MRLTVLYFARFREALGKDRDTVSGPFTTLDSVRQHLLAQGGYDVLGERNLMCARNEELCSLGEPVQDGDEVAFFPTVTGG